MNRRLVLLGLLVVTALACKESSSPFVFDALVVDGENGNPAAGTDADVFRVGIQEGEFPTQQYEFPVVDGQFEAVLEFGAFSLPTRIRAALEGPSTSKLTAPPAFIPAVSSGFLRVVMAEPSSCERVTFDQLEAPRAFFGMVQSGTFALIAGGTGPSNEQVEFFDALEWESRLFEEEFSVSDLGETRAASIDEGQILVLPENTAPFIFDMFDTTNRVTPVVLHLGAGSRSALVSVPGLGAMVIGGELAGEAQSAVSLVEPGGDVLASQLSEPRSGPSATALGMDVLVAGGNAEGNAEILVNGEDAGQPVADLLDGFREGGLLVGDGVSRALWIGGVDGVDAIRQDSVRFDGCPGTCRSSAGPSWPTARLDVLQPAQSALLIGGDDSSLVEEVRWSDATVEIQSVLQLQVPRAGAGGLVLESGAFVVAGGDDGASVRDDFEFCVPAALEPL
ncbi:MAG: hypothetical protein ACN4G0_14160 [Polyangiales bacterium]